MFDFSKILIPCLAALGTLGVFACKEHKEQGRYTNISDLAEKRLCVVEGTIYGEQLNNYYPKALKVSLADMNKQVEALKRGDCEGAVLDASKAPGIVAKHPEVAILQDTISEWTTRIAFGFPIGRNTGRLLCSHWIDSNHTLIDSLVQGWSKSPSTMPIPPRPSEGKLLRFGTSGTTAPTAILRGDTLVGQDIDLFYRFAAANGIAVEVVPMAFKNLIPALESGKVDAIGANITVTTSRSDRVAFTSPYKHEPVAVLVQKQALK
jgi:polar amino acid transport system substrate-binding protein